MMESSSQGGPHGVMKTVVDTSLKRAVLRACGDLFRSRESLLIHDYTQCIGDPQDDLLLPLALEEVRHRFENGQGVRSTFRFRQEVFRVSGRLRHEVLCGLGRLLDDDRAHRGRQRDLRQEDLPLAGRRTATSPE